MAKPLKSRDEIVQSLENLKKELELRDNDSYIMAREIWFKINSCLYSEYPHSAHKKVVQNAP